MDFPKKQFGYRRRRSLCLNLIHHHWSQKAYVKASNAGQGDSFGYAVSLSSDGQTNFRISSAVPRN